MSEGSKGDIKDWRWHVTFWLDWYGLRPFTEGTTVPPSPPSAGASEKYKLAYNRKMMAYWIIHQSLDGDA